MDSKSPLLRADADRPTRRSNAERTALTRAKLVDAAIQCLHRYGYAATTTVLVAKKAKVSRGAMLHHFPTKIDLVLAVAKQAVDFHVDFHRQKLRDYPRGRDRFLAITDVSWEAVRQPPAVALLEIMMATRSDKTLRERFPPLASQWEGAQREEVWALARDAGIKDRASIDAMVDLHLAAMRGLSISWIFAREQGNAEAAFKLLKWYKCRLTEHLLRQHQN